jgi:hypothetical protein
MVEDFITPSGNRLVNFLLPDGIDVYLVQLHENNADQELPSALSQVFLEYLYRAEEAEESADVLEPSGGANSVPATLERPRADGISLSSLRLKLLSDRRYSPMQVNTLQPVPFSNDLFEGKVLLMVNSAEEKRAPFLDIFKGITWKFELQVQGKFKKAPTGPIYFGGEITKKMELGMITRGICGGILQMGRSMNAHLHHSFGDKTNFELPHIVGPFWSSVDRLVVTPEGLTPPSFFASFPEDQKHRVSRKANPDYVEKIDLNTTYSFSLKTGSMDLEEWAIVTPIFTKAMSLSTFWSDADLRFTCYCMPAGIAGIAHHSSGLPKLHPQEHLQHFFSLEVQHASNHPEWEAEVPELAQSSRLHGAGNTTDQELFQPYERVAIASGEKNGVDDMDGSLQERLSGASVVSSADSDTAEFHDAVEGLTAASDDGEDSPYPPAQSVAMKAPADTSSYDGEVEDSDAAQESETERVSALLRDKLAMLQERIMTHTTLHAQDEPRTGKFAKSRPTAEASISSTVFKRSLIAAILDVDDCRRNKKGKRRTMYAFLANHEDLRIDAKDSTALGKNRRRYVLHSFGEWKDALPLAKLPPQPPNYTRYADDMRRKAQLSWSYESIVKGPRSDLQPVLADFLADTSNNAALLTPNPSGVGSRKLRASLPNFTMESLVCVQQGNYCWSEECMGITSDELVFIKPSKLLGNAVRLRIPLKDLLSVRKISEADSPLPIPGFHCFLIATFAKQYTVLIKGQDNRDSWVSALQSQSFYLSSAARSLYADPADPDGGAAGPPSLASLKRSSTFDGNNGPNSTSSFSISGASASFLEGMVVYPPEWNLGERMILNGRNFTCNGAIHQLSIRTLELGRLVNDPCALVEQLLEMAFRLAQFATAEDAQSWNLESPNRPRAPATVNAGQKGSLDNADPEQLWLDFMDGVSLLQCIDLSLKDNTSPESACLFLNLYHCMLLHAYMVVGLPNSLFKWSNFFRHCSYEAFGDVFSLAELEHCIMRAGMILIHPCFLIPVFILRLMCIALLLSPLVKACRGRTSTSSWGTS